MTDQITNTVTVHKGINARAHNRRIKILVGTTDKGEKVVLLKMRRLYGPWQDRKVAIEEVCFTLQSFIAVAMMFDMINGAQEFVEFCKSEFDTQQPVQYQLTTNIESLYNEERRF